MKFAFQIDPLEKIKFATDSSWALMKEAQKQGAEVFFYIPQSIIFKNNSLYAEVRELSINFDNSYDLKEKQIFDLIDFDIIFFRQDPPYDMAYLTTAHLLNKISDKVLIVNDPRGVINFPEKISVLNFPELTPPTAITSDVSLATDFAQENSQIIVKPLYSCGGEDVFLTSIDDKDFRNKLEFLRKKYNAPFIIQKYISSVIDYGDKRIILVDGEPVAVFARKPEEGSIKTNLAAGGAAFKTNLTEQDIKICKSISSFLKKNGLFFAGIDIIGDYLIEINITSPTGLVQIENLYGINIAQMIIEKLIGKLALN